MFVHVVTYFYYLRRSIELYCTSHVFLMDVNKKRNLCYVVVPGTVYVSFDTTSVVDYSLDVFVDRCIWIFEGLTVPSSSGPGQEVTLSKSVLRTGYNLSSIAVDVVIDTVRTALIRCTLLSFSSP